MTQDPLDTSWLASRCSADISDGFDATGWSASIWILHAMYEHSSQTTQTHDERRRQQIASESLSPAMIGGINLDEVGVEVGASLGMTRAPGPEWSRLRWRKLADRLDVTFGNADTPPCFRWFPYRSWPISIQPPCEGSLDLESFDALVQCLAEGEPDGMRTPCVASMCPIAAADSAGQAWPMESTLGSIPLHTMADQAFSPSNFWPADRSWLVYSSWDLWGTKVSGSTELIDRITAHPRLETMTWPGAE